MSQVPNGCPAPWRIEHDNDTGPSDAYTASRRLRDYYAEALVERERRVLTVRAKIEALDELLTTISSSPWRTRQLTNRPADPDAEAVRRMVSGDSSAIALLMERHAGVITGFLATKIGRLLSISDVEEIVQDTFVAVLRAVARFRGDSSVKTWLCRIAYNRALNRIAHNRRRRVDVSDSLDQPLGADDDRDVAGTIADASDVTREVADAETEDRVRLAMGRLSKSDQKIIQMRGIEHLSYDEIAAKLGINVGTVKSRLARARKALRLRVSRANRGFYRKSGRIDALIAAGHGNRAIRRETGAHTTTIAKRRRFLEARDGKIAACGCGQCATHRGWCSFRFQHSDRRKRFMARWHAKAGREMSALICPST